MSEAVDRALDYHKRGYNCAQAVACAFDRDLNIEEKDLFRMMEAFGFGMGSMGTCGAVSAMAAVIGLDSSDGNLEKPGTKRLCYKAMKKLTGRFEEMNRSVICRELKGVDSGEVLRSCDGCISDAVVLLEEYFDRSEEE